MLVLSRFWWPLKLSSLHLPFRFLLPPAPQKNFAHILEAHRTREFGRDSQRRQELLGEVDWNMVVESNCWDAGKRARMPLWVTIGFILAEAFYGYWESNTGVGRSTTRNENKITDSENDVAFSLLEWGNIINHWIKIKGLDLTIGNQIGLSLCYGKPPEPPHGMSG